MRIINFLDHKKEMIQIFAKAWTDEIFKQRLLNNPAEVLREFGISMVKGTKISFHLDTEDEFHANLPSKPKEDDVSDEQLKMIVGGVSATEYAKDIGVPVGISVGIGAAAAAMA